MINPQTLKLLLTDFPQNQMIQSAISGLYIYSADRATTAISYIQEPSICIVMQGEREIYLGTQCQRFDNSSLMFCPVNILLSLHIKQATPQKPVVALSMKLDLAMIQEVLSQMPPDYYADKTYLSIKWPLDEILLSAFERLINLLNYPRDIDFLAPLIQREIYYRLLIGPQGEKLRQLVTSDSHVRRITQATAWLKAHVSETVVVEQLAHSCGMGISSFHQHFKEITHLSPLQYQKSLRLMEARRQIQLGEAQVTQIATQVGYESPSQFSREYKRLFGLSPSKDKASN